MWGLVGRIKHFKNFFTRRMGNHETVVKQERVTIRSKVLKSQCVGHGAWRMDRRKRERKWGDKCESGDQK